ncbi:hypothetical protein NDU88_005519 [Pleurodeles waltl]|uniref:Uncharacterized protein n=1 Tax=Pleurodeles waltl TaxID=8319 RepID=A0AAV7PNU6_PLEWA|nr:hypothetical protein NDU88_005519 [Pleurodeles waltl]
MKGCFCEKVSVRENSRHSAFNRRASVLTSDCGSRKPEEERSSLVRTDEPGHTAAPLLCCAANPQLRSRALPCPCAAPCRAVRIFRVEQSSCSASTFPASSPFLGAWKEGRRWPVGEEREGKQEAQEAQAKGQEAYLGSTAIQGSVCEVLVSAAVMGDWRQGRVQATTEAAQLGLCAACGGANVTH